MSCNCVDGVPFHSLGDLRRPWVSLNLISLDSSLQLPSLQFPSIQLNNWIFFLFRLAASSGCVSSRQWLYVVV